MYKIIFQIILAAAVAIFCGCQTTKTKNWTSDDLVVSEQASFESLAFPKSISASQVAEDIDFLNYALSHGYGGRKYAPQDSFAQAIKTLKDITDVSSVAEFHEKIDEALFLIPDNHLSAVYRGRTSKKRESYFDENKLGRVGANNISDASKIWETRIDQVEKKKVLYISFTRFRSEKKNIWEGLIPSIKSKMKRSNFIVIDLRGCIGGSDDISIEMAKVLYGRAFEHGIKNQYRSLTPETLTFFINQSTVPIINMKADGEKAPAEFFDELSEAKERYNKALKGELPAESRRTGKGGAVENRSAPITGYNKPIYILTDRVCTSACEFTAAAFEWHPTAKRVGENTNGAFHFSNTGLLVLPNSKFKIYIPTQHSEYYDRRFIERTGLAPDIKVPNGSDAYEVVKQLIKKY
jgi:hypothetical protein